MLYSIGMSLKICALGRRNRDLCTRVYTKSVSLFIQGIGPFAAQPMTNVHILSGNWGSGFVTKSKGNLCFSVGRKSRANSAVNMTYRSSSSVRCFNISSLCGWVVCKR